MDNVINDIVRLLSRSQAQLKTELQDIATTSSDMYYLWRKSDTSKPMLCVHLDTINTHHNSDVVSKDNLVYYEDTLQLALADNTNLQCLGGDDRAGLYIALELIKYMEETGDYKYDVGFFCDEEIECLGSEQLITDNVFLNTSCFLGLDRRSHLGGQEVATYGYDNDELIAEFTTLGFTETIGSITDAAILAQHYNKACVNLSVGYDNEHTPNEVIYLSCMLDTLQILKTLNLPQRAYTFSPYYIEDGEIDNYRLFLNYLGYSEYEIDFIAGGMFEELGVLDAS